MLQIAFQPVILESDLSELGEKRIHKQGEPLLDSKGGICDGDEAVAKEKSVLSAAMGLSFKDIALFPAGACLRNV